MAFIIPPRSFIYLKEYSNQKNEKLCLLPYKFIDFVWLKLQLVLVTKYSRREKLCQINKKVVRPGKANNRASNPVADKELKAKRPAEVEPELLKRELNRVRTAEAWVT
jgi:hypothetical protein